ncbi:MAG: hypothetical protein ACKVS9_19210 [Phycisphaerae bacterium]
MSNHRRTSDGWRRNGVSIDAGASPSAAFQSLSLNDVQSGDQGLYDCVVASARFSTTTDVATLTVNACVADVDGHRAVTFADLAILLTNFGQLSDPTLSHGDLDADGDVDLIDLANLLTGFGEQCV